MSDDMDAETTELVRDYIRFKLDRAGIETEWQPVLGWRPSQIHLSLRSLGEEFEQKYTETFNEMCTNLNFTEETAEDTFNGVLGEVFGQGVTWARIIASFSFAGSLALQCHTRDMPNHVPNVARWFIEYINRHLKTWICDHGGWNGIVIFQQGPMEEKEATWHAFRNFFCGIAAGAIGALTIGAVLTSRS